MEYFEKGDKPPCQYTHWPRRGPQKRLRRAPDRTAHGHSLYAELILVAPRATTGALDPCGSPSLILFYPLPVHTHTHTLFQTKKPNYLVTE